jgi:flagellar hook-basal body complex protein FliE
MMNVNPTANPFSPAPAGGVDPMAPKAPGAGSASGFADTVKAAQSQLGKVNDLQRASDVSIQDLLAGRNEDITSVVSSVAKADMSFKLLIGVRNKLVEAYKETMNMPL